MRKEIVETGCMESNGKWYINYSSILTELICSAGRFCEYYASDLFIDWKAIDEKLTGEDIFSLDGTDVFYFGMRESGVDHESFIRSRIAENHGQYRALYRLEVTRKDGEMKMILKRMDAFDMRRELA